MTIVCITGEIDAATVSGVRAASMMAPAEPLTIIIDSPGGLISPALAVADVIEAHRGPTVCRVNRRADSAALIVVSAFDLRSARASATFYLHPTADLAPPAGRLTADRLHRAAIRLEASDVLVRRRIADNIGCNVAELTRLEASNATLTAIEALNLGILTEIPDLPAATAAAAQRRRARASSTTTLPNYAPALVRQMAAAGMVNRPIGVPRAMFRAMLERAR